MLEFSILKELSHYIHGYRRTFDRRETSCLGMNAVRKGLFWFVDPGCLRVIMHLSARELVPAGPWRVADMIDKSLFFVRRVQMRI